MIPFEQMTPRDLAFQLVASGRRHARTAHEIWLKSGKLWAPRTYRLHLQELAKDGLIVRVETNGEWLYYRAEEAARDPRSVVRGVANDHMPRNQVHSAL